MSNDIHRQYAAQIFQCTEDVVTEEQRDFAKRVMLAQMYGMGPSKLSKIAPTDIVAYFDKDGSVRCKECLSTPSEISVWWDGVPPVRIYAVNLSPYTQDCHVCDKIVYQGPTNVILFTRGNVDVIAHPPYAWGQV